MARSSSTFHAHAARNAQRTGLLPLLTRMAVVWRHRRELETLPPERLRDLGLSPDDLKAERQRPLWDAPANWRL